MKKIILLVLYFAGILRLNSQNPANISIPTPTPNPANLSADSYTRASSSINLLAGFKYGFVSGGATNFLNLNISSNPGFVSSEYLGSGTHPDPDACNNPPQNSNKPVGETSGNFYVSQAGAAMYNIPIIISPGTKNVQPNISIKYSSQAGTGLLGNGWMLGGLSSITRTGKIPLHDGKFDGVDLSSNDVFELDGNRLFALVGTYGQSNTTYYTESESFATITSYNTTTDGPEKFEIKDKNGNTLVYGLTSNSKLTGVSNTKVLSWYLEKITDEFGNYMTYAYKQFFGEIVIDKITYTGNQAAGLNPYNSVTFEYMDLAEKKSYYINGIEFRNTKLIKAITSLASGSLVRKYSMSYSWNKGTYLSSITEVDSDGNELVPTTFCWGDPHDDTGIKNAQNTPVLPDNSDYVDLQTIAADLDGDGFSDYVCYNTGAPKRLRVMKNTFKANFGTSNSSITFNNVFDNPSQLSASDHFLSTSVTDENNDNKKEVYTMFSDTYGAYNSLSKSYYILKVSIGSGSSVDIANIGSYNIAQYDVANTSAFFYDVSDYTGDGVNDIVRMDPTGIYLTASGNTYSYAFTNTVTCYARPISFNSSAAREFIVFEYMGPNYTDMKILSFTGSGFQHIYSNTRNDAAVSNFSYGDVNSDGIDDLAFTTNTNKMYVCKGDGISFLPPFEVTAYTPLTGAIKITDINGDGNGDITITSATDHHTYYSFGDVIVKGGSYTGAWSSANVDKVFYTNYPYDYKTIKTSTKTKNISVNTSFNMNSADLNGDGVADITSFGPGQQSTVTNYINGAVRQVIRKITTPLKKKIEIRYGNIGAEICANAGGSREQIYKKQSTVTYIAPFTNLKPNLNCVTNVRQSSGLNYQLSNESKYMYSDAVYHRLGKGFLGFEQVLSFDVFTETGTLSKTIFNTTYCTPSSAETTGGKITASLVGNIIEYSFDALNPVSKTENLYTTVPRNAHGYFVELSSAIQRDYLNSTQEKSVYTYDLIRAGNVSGKTTIYGWTGQTPIKTLYTANTFVLNNGIYKPKSQTTTQTQNGQPDYERLVNYTYDSNGHLTSTVNYANISGHDLTTTYSSFNNFGAPTNVSTAAPDVPIRGSSVMFDATGRFLIKSTDAIGNFKTFSFEPKYGNTLSETGITGLTTNYFYDGLGRLAQIIYPNQTQTKITYAWESPLNYDYDGGTPLGVYSVKTQPDASGYSKVYYGSNGETLRQETQDFAGQVVVTDTKYALNGTGPHPDGFVLETTEPHYPAQPSYMLSRFDYEPDHFRKISTKTYTVSGSSAANTGIFSTTTFNTPSTDSNYNPAFQKTENQNSQAVKKYTNAAGQVEKIENIYPGLQQNVVYTYHSCGQPVKIDMSNSGSSGPGILQTFTYDDLGHKESMDDPSLGNITYTYNTIGELVGQDKPNGSFTYAYDVLGRLNNKVGAVSGATTYQYVTSGNGKEMVSKIYGPVSTAEFAYDNFNRIIESKETITADNKILKSKYEYDTYGREIKHTYPGGVITKNEYNGLGHLLRIKNSNDQTIWELVSKDALGRVIEYNYGNGITTKNKFDKLNHLSEIDHGNGGIHKQIYTYDDLTGNLNSRVFKDFLNTTELKDAFTFDALDRLKNSNQLDPQDNSLQNTALDYDDFGNITHKDDCGDLEYNDSGNPIRLTQITNTTGNINLNTLSVQYNDLDKVKNIIEEDLLGAKQMDFIYGVGDARIKVDYSIGGTTIYKRYYAENYDREETAGAYKEWTYITAPSGLCAVYYNNNGTTELNYVLSDHLGSPILLTNTNAQAVERYAFDSWGRRRNPVDWSYTTIPASQKMIRGFTLHEMIDEFNFINMNARVYDPVLGRFVQPDDRITDAENIQTYNIYAYCLNNPLKYTDPSGHETVPGTDAAISTQFSALSTAVYTYDSYRYDGIPYAGYDPTMGAYPSDTKFESMGYDHYWNANTPVVLPTSSNGYVAPLGPSYNLLTSADLSNGMMLVAHAGLDALGMVPGIGEFADGLNAAIYGYEGDYLNAGLSAAATIPFGGAAATFGKWTNRASNIWTGTKNLSPVENAFAHFQKHTGEFPEFYNSKQYVQGTQNFLSNPPPEALTKIRSNGDVLIYHPETNTFGVMNSSGTPKTMFRPDDGIDYWQRQ